MAGGWSSPNQSGIWTMRRVVTPALAAGTALVLDANAVLVLDRESPQVFAANTDRDRVIKNMVTLLGEIRLGMAIMIPQAIAKVKLPVVTP